MSRDRGAEEPEFEPGYTGWTSEEKDRMETIADKRLLELALPWANCKCLDCEAERGEKSNGTSDS